MGKVRYPATAGGAAQRGDLAYDQPYIQTAAVEPELSTGEGISDAADMVEVSTVPDYIIQTNEILGSLEGLRTAPAMAPQTDFAFGQSVVPTFGVGSQQGVTSGQSIAQPPFIPTPITPTEQLYPPFRMFFPPASFMPLLPFFPSYRKKPRKQRTLKRRKRKIWWDVPSQPLGEPWNPKEYIVFGTAGTRGEPRKVRKKEKKKKLDSIFNYDFGQEGKARSSRKDSKTKF